MVYCNFGDSYWVTRNLSSLNDSSLFEHFTIIDQNSLPNSKSASLTSSDFDNPTNIRIIKNSYSPYQHASYQHAEAVNKTLNLLTCSCERIWIVDTDLFVSPKAVEWLDKKMDHYDAIFMQDPLQSLFSHPCLMIVRRENLGLVNLLPTEISLIDPRQSKPRLVDTGRILAAKLSETGLKVALVRRNLEKRFRPRIFGSIHQPDFYLDGEIVHFRSMSFSTRDDAKQRLRIMDEARYYFPRRVVDKIMEKRPESFSGFFTLFHLKRIGFYLELLTLSKILSRFSRN